MHGFKFLDKNGKVLLEAGFSGNKHATVRTFTVDRNEKILGFQSRIEQRYEN